MSQPACNTHLDATPTFEAFVELKRQLLGGAQPNGLLDLCETRMAKVLTPYLTDAHKLPLPAVGYRCHVAEEWLAAFGLPSDWKPRALVTQGVRASLEALLRHYAALGCQVAMPSDVYPVYLTLAARAGTSPLFYESLDAGALERLLGTSSSLDVLVVTEPFKPRGTHLTLAESQAIEDWLAQGPLRRLVVDAVYCFDSALSAQLRKFVDSGQAIVLHSLSKGWARPLHAGIALVPQADVATLTPAFRGLPVDREALRVAQGLLQHDREQPRRLRVLLQEAEARLRQSMAQQGVPLQPPSTEAMAGQYLFVVERAWTELLEDDVLALPASVFGSARSELSVVSSLSFVRPPQWTGQL